MQDRPVLTHGLLACRHQNLAQVTCFHFLTAEINARGIDIARQSSSRNIDDQAVDGKSRHTLGRIDRKTDHAFQRVKISNHAGFHATRTLVANADDFHLVGAARQDFTLLTRRQPADHAHDLGRTDIQHRNDVAALGRQRLQPRQAEMGRTEKAHVFFSAFLRALVRASTAA
ncbi:hypothetical protein D3C86_1353500 [compost metagenome]